MQSYRGSHVHTPIVVTLAALIFIPAAAQQLAKTPRRAVPAQQLRLLDSTGSTLATTSVLTDNSFVFHDGGISITIDRAYGLAVPMLGDKQSLWLHMRERDMYVAGRGPSGKEFTLTTNADSVADEETIDRVVPTKDVLLTYIDDTPLGIAGMSPYGEPAIVFVDRETKPLAAWKLVKNPNGYPEIDLYTARRHSLKAMITTVPPVRSFCFFETNGAVIEPWAVDAVRGTAVKLPHGWNDVEGPARLEWLDAPTKKASLPIRLVDQRDHTLWQAP